MIKKFYEYLSDYSDKYLLYYAFDWDDNIFYMPTIIHMENLIDGKWVKKDISTSEFAKIRTNINSWRLLDNNPDKGFSEFRDFGKRGDKALIEDLKIAVKRNKYGPAWLDFKECLTNGSLFAIITARGHEDETIKKAIVWIIDNLLSEDELHTMYNNLLKFSYLFKDEKIEEYDKILNTDKPSNNQLIINYLNNCDFIGVSAPSRGGSSKNPENDKVNALMNFSKKVNNFAINIGYKSIIGFSDDDIRNVKHVEDLIDNINNEDFSNIYQYVIKNTKDPKNITKKVKILSETSNQSPGLESSVMPFTQFNNMTDKLYPKGPENRQDDYANQLRRQTEYLAKTSKEILKKRKRVKRKKDNENI